jgi:hypothetical protein
MCNFIGDAPFNSISLFIFYLSVEPHPRLSKGEEPDSNTLKNFFLSIIFQTQCSLLSSQSPPSGDLGGRYFICPQCQKHNHQIKIRTKHYLSCCRFIHFYVQQYTCINHPQITTKHNPHTYLPA